MELQWILDITAWLRLFFPYTKFTYYDRFHEGLDGGGGGGVWKSVNGKNFKGVLTVTISDILVF